MAPTVEELRRQFRRAARLDRYTAILADDDGDIYDGNYMKVRAISSGTLQPATRVPNHGVFRVSPGAAVKLGYDEKGKLVIVGADYDATIAAGVNPHIHNPGDPYVYGRRAQSSVLQLFSAPTNPVGTTVAVAGLVWYDGTLTHRFPGQVVDMGSYIPSSGEHRVAGLFLKPDNTIGVGTSDANSTSDPITTSDVRAAYDARPTNARPVWYYRLHDNQTQIQDADKYLDGRELVNAPGLTVSDANVSNPPTAAELTTLFGSASDVGYDFHALINDAGLGTNVYAIYAASGSYWYASLTKAT